MAMKWSSSTASGQPEESALKKFGVKGLLLRQADQRDAALLAELGARTFQDAFAYRMNPEDVAAYLAGAFTPEQMRQELADPLSTFVIALAEGEPAGYARLYQGHKPDCVAYQPAIELGRFYVCKLWWGRGVSGVQMEVCLDLARQGGCAGIWLSSWKLNDRANAFYRKWGFAIAGEKTFTVGSDVQEDFVLARRLDEDREAPT